MAGRRLEEYNIVFFPSGLRGTFEPGTSIFEAATRLGVDLATICGGAGECGKCKVVIEEGAEALGPLTPSEEAHLTEEEKRQNYRLACMISLPEGVKRLVIRVPETSRLGAQRLQTEGLEVDVKIDPFVRKYHLIMKRGSLEDDRADEIRLLDYMRDLYGFEDLEIPWEVATIMPKVLREKGGTRGDFNVTVVVYDDKKVIAVEPGDTTDRCYGLAVDIGSTKLAGFLMDLNTGKVVAVSSRMNPQIPYGEDVLSRLTYAKRSMEALKTVQQAVINGINDMITEMCELTGIKPEEIYEGVFVGNTAMQHLFLGIWPKFMSLAPYPAGVKRGMKAPADKLGLKLHPNGYAWFAPIIRGFVGADQVAAELVVDYLEIEDMVLELDIGTNTEITLGNKHNAYCVSCASGPAFEGMMISCGMRASNGAIERIRVDPETRELEYKVITGIWARGIRSCSKYRRTVTKPIGICGSALCDVLPEFVRAGIILPSGQFNKELLDVDPRLRKRPDGQLEYVIVFAEDTAHGKDITISQNDIRELQKAKAAMFTGCYLLMKEMGVTTDDIDELVIAGAFGSFIDPESARTMGMYPEVPLKKIRTIGNAAGTGARMALVSREARKKMEKLADWVKFIEAAIHPDFMKIYPEAMYIPNKNLDLFPETAAILKELGRI
ncbi:ASKHA domain-containing protein [Candidatus Alkanophaga liquidiphilum]|nr:2Fe-2S and 4Fe-4S clusters-containing protein [Candidatus Alkanophaga liquidiphilum]